MTDIVLDQGSDGDWIRMESQVVQVVGSSIMLGDMIDPAVDATWRRALVRTDFDGLSVNYRKDFTGGLALNGVRVINGHVAPDAPIDPVAAVTGATTPALEIHGQVWFQMAPSSEIGVHGEHSSHRLTSLQAVIQELRDSVATFGAPDPDGLQLKGVKSIRGYRAPNSGPPNPVLADVGISAPELTIKGQIYFELFPAADLSAATGTADHEVVSLQATVQSLRDDIAALQAQVAELAAKVA